jgi:hypothetical protein
VSFAIGSREPKIERLRVGSQHLGERGEGGVHLSVPILRRANDRRIEPERDVVHEHSPVDGGQVHPAFPGLAEGVERSDHVLAVQAQVQG